MPDLRHSRLDVEQYVAGELDRAAAARVSEHVDGCAECSAYMGQVKQEKSEFLARHSFGAFERACAEKEHHSWLGRLFGPVLRPAAIPAWALVAALLVVIPLSISRYMNRQQVTQGITYKGGAAVSFLCKRGETIAQGNLNDTFGAGDEIQVVYSLSKKQQVALLSVDQKGQVTFYHTDQSGPLCTVEAGPGQQLSYPSSIRLDNSPGYELVIVLFGSGPLNTADIRSWIQGEIAAGGGDIAARSVEAKLRPPFKGVTVSTLLLKKGQ